MNIVRADGLASITVVIPTMNRSMLERATRSVDGADEVIVVGDRVRPTAGQIRIKEPSGEPSDQPGARAAELRNVGMRRATGDWVAFMDDDDAFAPGAIDIIRTAVSGKPPALYLFRMLLNNGVRLWAEPFIAHGNVGTPMIVCPSHGWLPWPTKGYLTEDYGFAELNRRSWVDEVVFREEIIAHINFPP